MRHSNLKLLISGLLCWFLATSYAMAATELVNNGNFATGDFTGWTLSTNADTTLNFVGPGQDYNPAATFGQSGSVATMSQTLTTTAGNLYNFSFQLSNGSYTDLASSSFSAALDGVTQYTTTGPLTGTYNFTTQFTALSNATNLTFSFQNDSDFYYLQNVSFQSAQSSVAAPGPIAGAGLPALIGMAAFAGFAGLRRRNATSA